MFHQPHGSALLVLEEWENRILQGTTFSNKVKEKSFSGQVAHVARAYPGFHSMKRLRV